MTMRTIAISAALAFGTGSAAGITIANLRSTNVEDRRAEQVMFLPVLPSDYTPAPAITPPVDIPRKVKTVRAHLDISGGKSLAEAPIIVEPMPSRTIANNHAAGPLPLGALRAAARFVTP
jgi:hypothetical protein